MIRLLSKALVVGLIVTAASPATAARCDLLRAMTYNVRNDTPSDGDNRWERRREEFIGQVELMRPDILGLQEVLSNQKRDLEAAMPSYEFLGVGRDDGQERGEYSSLAVLKERYVVRSSGTFWLSETPERPSKGWDAAFPRIATWARLSRRSDGQRILAINTHLDNAGPLARLQGARQIVAFVEAHRRTGETVILTGDFNSTPESAPVEAVLASSAALRDSRADSLSPPIGPVGTFNGFNPLPAHSRRIDYIFHDPSLRTTRSATLAWHGDGGRVASDHFPVVADLIDASCRP